MGETELKRLADEGQLQSLSDYLDDHPDAEGFTPTPHYAQEGDYLVLFFQDVPCYAQRIDPLLTVYYSNDRSDLVGFKIKGLSLIAKHVASLIDHDDDVEINLLLLSAVGSSDVRHKYYDLGQRAKGITIQKSQIPQLA